MANNCFFEMRITGKKENIDELIEMIHDRNVDSDLGRVFSCDVSCEEEINGITYIDVVGDCAWSVENSMMPGCIGHNLVDESKRLNLVIEIYSSEYGNCFQEHILIIKGDIDENETVHYEEHWVSGYNSLKEYNEDNETCFTEDMLNDNGDVVIGGFGENYGKFEFFDNWIFEEEE